MNKIISYMLICLTVLCFVSTPGIAKDTVYRLSLQQVTEIAIENNFDIQLAKYDALIQQTNEMAAKSIYDTVFDAEVKYRKNERKQPTTFSGTKTQENDYNFGLSKKLSTGTTLEFDMTNERESTNSVFSTSPLIHDSTMAVSVEQSMGRNFLGMQDRGSVEITLLDIENSNFTSLDKIESVLAETQRAYWDLVLQEERVEIEKDMVEQAKKLFDLNQKKLEDGLTEIPDAIAAEANYEKVKNRLKLAQNTYKRKVNVLKLLLNRSDIDVMIEPTEQLSVPETQHASIQSLGKAFDNRRDYKQAMNNIESKDISLSLSKNNLWPEINLVASLARNGLGDHFNDSAKAITEENNPNFFAGLTFVIPLENRRARAELKAAELEKARILLDTKFLEKKISIEIIDQVRDCNVFSEIAKNEQMIADLQIRKLDEELKRFNRGRSDTDTIIRFQEDVILARLAAAEAKFRYQTALIELQRKEATLLQKYKGEQL